MFERILPWLAWVLGAIALGILLAFAFGYAVIWFVIWVLFGHLPYPS